DVAGPDPELLPVRAEDHRRRPAPVLPAARDFRARVLVHLDRDVVLREERGDGRIAVRLGVHDVAPVAPHGLEVHEDELLLARGVCEGALVEGAPVNLRRPAFRKRRRETEDFFEGEEGDGKRRARQDAFGAHDSNYGAAARSDRPRERTHAPGAPSYLLSNPPVPSSYSPAPRPS